MTLSIQARLFRKFSRTVDEIDSYRQKLPPDSRSKSKVLHKLYVYADLLLVRLRRLER